MLVEDPDARPRRPPLRPLPLRAPASLAARARARRRTGSPSPARASAARRTTASPRRSTSPTPTTTASSSPPTAAARRWGDLSDPTVLGGPAPLDLAGLHEPRRRTRSRSRTSRRRPSSATCTCTSATSTAALAFYRDVIGFEVMTLLDSAAFVAAGGYHHHLGLNIWRGRGAPPVPAGVVGLRHWTIVIPEDAAAALRERVIAAGAPYEDTPDGPARARPVGHPAAGRRRRADAAPPSRAGGAGRGSLERVLQALVRVRVRAGRADGRRRADALWPGRRHARPRAGRRAADAPGVPALRLQRRRSPGRSANCGTRSRPRASRSSSSRTSATT